MGICNRNLTALFFAATACLVLGCAGVAPPKPFSLALPAVAMNEGAVALQVAVVQIDEDQAAEFESFFAQLDTMKLPLNVRKAGDRNGFRYAVMSPQTPSTLQSLLQRRELDTSTLTDLQKKMASKGLLESPPRLLSHQQIENDAGESFEVNASGYYPQKSWSFVNQFGRNETGQGDLVKGVIDVTPFPQGNGAVRLSVVPEIHHGQPQTRFSVSQRTFLFNETQIQSAIEALKFSVDLQPGETLVVAPIATVERLGALFFGGDQANGQADGQANGQGESGSHLSGSGTSASVAADQSVERAFDELDTMIASGAMHLGVPGAAEKVDPEAGNLLGEDRQLDLTIDGIDALMLDSESDSETVARSPLTPHCRFMMIRVLHAQGGDLFEADDASERLTTVNHQ